MYLSDPNVPVAFEASYGKNIFGPSGVAEGFQVGADVPAGKNVHWMIELYGVTRLTPQTFSGHRREVALDPGVSLVTIHHRTPASGATVQILEGEIRGPARGFSLLRTVSENPVGYEVNGIQSVSGDTTGRIVTESHKYILGELPYVFAIGPNDVAGGPASAPGISDGKLLVPGRWFFPRRAFVEESYTAPLGARVMYVEPPTTQTGRMTWQSGRYVRGRFGLAHVAVEAAEQSHQFWAGIALGIGGAAAIAALQAGAAIPRRRRRRTSSG